MPTLPVQIDPRAQAYARTVPSRASRGVAAVAFGQTQATETRRPRRAGGRDDAQSQQGDALRRRWAGPLWRLGRRCDVGAFERAGPVVAVGAIECAQPRLDGEAGTARSA